MDDHDKQPEMAGLGQGACPHPVGEAKHSAAGSFMP
jgi:hypothetical protein